MKFMTFFRSKNKILLSVVTLLAMLLLLNMYLTNMFTMGAFYNSDALYVPDIVSDILVDYRAILSWNLSRAPSFFDIFIFLIINSLFDSYISIAIFFIVQVLITVILTHKIYRVSFNEELSVIATCSSIMAICYILLNQIHPYFTMLKSAHHYSEFIIWLVSSYYLLCFLKNPLRKSLYLPMVLFFLACISDQLYYIHFVIPALIFCSVYIFISKPEYKGKIIKALILMLISSLLAIYISSLMFINNESEIKIDINLSNVIKDFKQLYSYVLFLNTKSIIILFINVVFYIMCFIKVIKKDKNYEWIIFYLFSLFVSILLLAISPSSNILGRYLLPYIFVPFLFFFLIVSPSFLQYKKPLLWITLAILTMYNLSIYKYKEWSYRYYPDHVSCVDSALKKRNIKSIIGDYWVARHYTFLSHANIIVTPFKLGFTRDTIVSRRGEFSDSFSGVLVDSIDGRGFKQGEVIKQLGISKEVIKCPKVTLLIYNKGSLIKNDRKILINNENL
ncbi:hypothetical protein MNBD_GAMMA03-7 [hydrothermal vent metagenome]|uniref:Glycosyltransferase RgtA/B/C/D-like domain-containing protein n=1 Tax=hydrothermal vent metagenome TaxID=652676 RepID=A0A3B0W1T1_9ZZZZ